MTDLATSLISGLSSCAGLVIAPKAEAALKHIEFVNLGPGRALVVLVFEGGVVENRVVDVPLGTPLSSLIEATNYLSTRLIGRTLAEVKDSILAELDSHQAELSELTERVVAAGLATWSGSESDGSLIVRGQSKLLDDVSALEDLEKVRLLFEMLETKKGFLRLLDSTQDAEGVQIFIGSENQLFSHAGCSMIIAPYADSRETIVGAIGVVGPTRMNYARIIPLVDYTAQVIGKLMG